MSYTLITLGAFGLGPWPGDNNAFQLAGYACLRLLPVGMVMPWLLDSMPDRWLRCDGSDASRTDYSDLFGVFETTFGAGDGETTFGLPDLRGLFPIGADGPAGVSVRDTAGDLTHSHTLPFNALLGPDPQSLGAGSPTSSDSHLPPCVGVHWIVYAGLE